MEKFLETVKGITAKVVEIAVGLAKKVAQTVCGISAKIGGNILVKAEPVLAYVALITGIIAAVCGGLLFLAKKINK